MNDDFLTVKTPAKLILSGEHAVLQGCPAIALAIDRYMQATVRWTSPLHFTFNLMGIDVRRQVTLQALRKLKNKLKKQYQRYSRGHLSIRDVLQHPLELSLFTFINVLDRLKNKLPMGLDIVTDSNIPVGYGLESSAASVVSLIYALSQFLGMPLPLEEYTQLGIESENLQHGLSSGLDVHTVYHGGFVHYQQGQLTTIAVNDFSMQLVETGKPQSTTGECVTHSKKQFQQQPSLKNEFTTTTQALQEALLAEDHNGIQAAIRNNHRLLQKIAVVPDTVSRFIAEVEAQGGAAKICGAGSIRGETGGAVLVTGSDDTHRLTQRYGYTLTPIHADRRGTHVI